MTTRPLFLLIVASLALANTSLLAAPYKWVDKDGKTHYSDKPPPAGVKAEQVELKPLTEITATPVPQSDGSGGTTEAPVAVDASGYTNFRITSPADQTTLRDPSAPLAIAVSLDPPLSGDDRIEFTLDGKVVESPIPGLERGAHQIGARVLSANGGERIAAPTVTVYLHQTTVTPVAPPKPKPKPKTP